jgi:hypothetical protein
MGHADATLTCPRYRLEHHREHAAPSVVMTTETLASALVELAIVRRWFRAGHADGCLVVIDQQATSECRIGTYRIDNEMPDLVNRNRSQRGPRRNALE